MTSRAPLIIVLLVAATLSHPASSAEPSTWDVWYSASARERGARADADLLAGGRLTMTGLPSSSGAFRLSSSAIVEHPWKLYWVDPLGPFGEEIKAASVVTLPETTWLALEAARNENAAFGRLRHQRWLEHAEKPRKLDGSFAFIVIGPVEGRFRFDVGAHGAISEATNRMTHRWLPGPFDQFVGTELVPNGYWFWNNGEVEPFDYEPHTYHAFAAALELLAVPLPRLPGSVLSWPDVVKTASEVLSTLAPKGRAWFSAIERQIPVETPVRATTLPNGELRLRIEFSHSSHPLHVERETVFSSDGRPASSRARVRLESRRDSFFEVEVGYRTIALVEDSYD